MADVTGAEVTIGTALVIINRTLNWLLGRKRDKKHKLAEGHITGKLDEVLDKVDELKKDVDKLKEDVDEVKGHTGTLTVHVSGEGGLLFRTRRLEGIIFRRPDDMGSGA